MKRAYLKLADDPIRCAYLAGILDGEGCLGIGLRIRRGCRYIVATVQVTNTDVRLLEWLMQYYEGNIYPRSKEVGNRKPVYLWSVASRKAMRVVNDAFPYLIVKREQALLLRSIPNREPFRDTTTGRMRVRFTEADFAENDRLLAEIRALNKRGL